MENKLIMNDLEELLKIDNIYTNPSIELVSEHIILNGEAAAGDICP